MTKIDNCTQVSCTLTEEWIRKKQAEADITGPLQVWPMVYIKTSRHQDIKTSRHQDIKTSRHQDVYHRPNLERARNVGSRLLASSLEYPERIRVDSVVETFDCLSANFLIFLLLILLFYSTVSSVIYL